MLTFEKLQVPFTKSYDLAGSVFLAKKQEKPKVDKKQSKKKKGGK